MLPQKETGNWMKCKELDDLLHSTNLSECASLHCSLMWTPLYLTQCCARILYFHSFAVFDKFRCYYFSANLRVPSEALERAFRRNLEVLTFDDMRQCLSGAVQSTGVEVGIRNGAFLDVGSWNKLRNVLQQYKCVVVKWRVGIMEGCGQRVLTGMFGCEGEEVDWTVYWRVSVLFTRYWGG
jgi:hypothetical protein